MPYDISLMQFFAELTRLLTCRDSLVAPIRQHAGGLRLASAPRQFPALRQRAFPGRLARFLPVAQAKQRWAEPLEALSGAQVIAQRWPQLTRRN